MKNIHWYILSITIILSSCFKEDEMIPPHDPGELIEAEVAMHQKYTYQVYFDLYTAQSIASNEKDIFDLVFECGEDGWHILLNTASRMYAGASGSDDFNAPIDTTGFTWKFDKSDGNLDSTAIGYYFVFDSTDVSRIYTNEVYVLDMGYDINANPKGLKKVVFQNVNDSSYTIRWADMDNENEHISLINKDEQAHFAYFSFDNGGIQVYPEPLPDEYDLLFTQYTTLLFTDLGDPHPYLVTGVLINRKSVQTVRDTTLSFDDITYENALAFEFTDQLDNIGWDWKDLEGDVIGGGTPVYVIVEGLHYIVRDTEGYLYKLRFSNFYNKFGEKGFPNFEYQRL